MSIASIIDGIITREGGYVDNKSDLGGSTKFGVTEKVARAAGYQGAMQDFPRQLAVEIYTKQYVIAPHFDLVATVSPAIAEECIDTAVNMGTSIPGPWLQRVLNALNLSGTLYQDLKVDGQIGPTTIGALKIFLNYRSSDGERVVLRALNCLQGARYIELTEARQANRAFVYGWLLNRVGV